MVEWGKQIMSIRGGALELMGGALELMEEHWS